jgi:hypothetical protein
MSDISLRIDCLEETLRNLRSLLADPCFTAQLDNDALYALLAERGLAEEECTLDEWRAETPLIGPSGAVRQASLRVTRPETENQRCARTRKHPQSKAEK